ncbi:MAG: HAMP domain-containing protein, partial [Gaiellaceae bacterium]
MRSLRARLFAAIALATVAAVAVSLVLGAWLVRRQVRQEAVRALSRQADLIAKQQRTAKAPGALGTFLETQQERLAIVGREQAAQLLPDAGAAALRQGRGSRGTVEVQGTRFLYAARPSGNRAIVLLRAERLQSEDWSPFGFGLVLAGLVGVVLAGGAAFVLARALTLPLARVAAASRRLAAGERHEPLPLSGPTEFVALARAFDEMAADLDRARAAQRAFLLSVSHE